MNSKIQNPDFYKRLRLVIGDEEPYAWAKRVGIPSATFHRIWNEGTVPKSEHLIRIKESCGVDLNWLLTGEGTLDGKADLPEVDGETLVTVIIAVEDTLASLGVVLPPEKKAEAIKLFYRHYTRNPGAQQMDDITEWLRFSLLDDTRSSGDSENI